MSDRQIIMIGLSTKMENSCIQTKEVFGHRKFLIHFFQQNAHIGVPLL